jgi:hypothetical protein
MGDSERDEAIELAKKLRAYHNEYFSRATEDETPLHDSKKEDVAIEDIDDEPINLSDIPF